MPEFTIEELERILKFLIEKLNSAFDNNDSSNDFMGYFALFAMYLSEFFEAHYVEFMNNPKVYNCDKIINKNEPLGMDEIMPYIFIPVSSNLYSKYGIKNELKIFAYLLTNNENVFNFFSYNPLIQNAIIGFVAASYTSNQQDTTAITEEQNNKINVFLQAFNDWINKDNNGNNDDIFSFYRKCKSFVCEKNVSLMTELQSAFPNENSKFADDIKTCLEYFSAQNTYFSFNEQQKLEKANELLPSIISGEDEQKNKNILLLNLLLETMLKTEKFDLLKQMMISDNSNNEYIIFIYETMTSDERYVFLSHYMPLNTIPLNASKIKTMLPIFYEKMSPEERQKLATTLYSTFIHSSEHRVNISMFLNELYKTMQLDEKQNAIQILQNLLTTKPNKHASIKTMLIALYSSMSINEKQSVATNLQETFYETKQYKLAEALLKCMSILTETLPEENAEYLVSYTDIDPQAQEFFTSSFFNVAKLLKEKTDLENKLNQLQNLLGLQNQEIQNIMRQNQESLNTQYTEQLSLLNNIRKNSRKTLLYHDYVNLIFNDQNIEKPKPFYLNLRTIKTEIDQRIEFLEEINKYEQTISDEELKTSINTVKKIVCNFSVRPNNCIQNNEEIHIPTNKVKAKHTLPKSISQNETTINEKNSIIAVLDSIPVNGFSKLWLIIKNFFERCFANEQNLAKIEAKQQESLKSNECLHKRLSSFIDENHPINNKTNHAL